MQPNKAWYLKCRMPSNAKLQQPIEWPVLTAATKNDRQQV
jgi:hypothetical protein